MKEITALVAAVLVAAIAGCDYVMLDAPVGDPLAEDEKARFVGRWTVSDSQVCDIERRQDGMLVLGALTWNDADQEYRAANYVIDARKVGDTVLFILLHGPLVGNGEWPCAFCRVEHTGQGEFSIYAPDAAEFRAAAEAKKLDGKVRSESEDAYTFQIHGNSPSTQEALAVRDLAAFFREKDGRVFRKVTKGENKKAEPGVGADSR